MLIKIAKWTAFAFVLLIIATLASIYVPNAISPELGVTNGQLTPLKDTPNGVSTQTDDATKRVEPWSVKATAETTMTALLTSVDAYGRHVVKEQTDNYLYVVFITPTMRYRDDAEFFIDSENGLVHFRSNSRVGSVDMGLNRQRYEALAATYAVQ